MKVYLVFYEIHMDCYCCGTGPELIEAYDSLEKAQNFIATKSKRERSFYSIEEKEVK